MRFVQFLFFRHALVRGATQREVKLEITGNQNEELIKYLDDIFLGLRYQDGHYDLVKLHDKEYQDKLQVQSDYWEKLKKEIEAVRSDGYENTDIVNMSEIYFHMADETVFAAFYAGSAAYSYLGRGTANQVESI